MPPKRTRKSRRPPPPPRRRKGTVKPKSKGPRKAKGFSAVRLGQRLGNVFSPAIGRVGAEAGRLFKQVTGFGDYKVNKNTLMNSDPLPTFKNLSNGTRVIHREYLFDVITAETNGAFKIQKIPIQPALGTSFPWLAASAENYQEYKLNGCIFEFKSNSYNAVSSTDTASGTVVMSTDYNALDPPFPNKFQMEQSQYTCSAKPSVNLMHPIECAKLETPTSVLFTRPGPVTSGDLRLYDWANFYIATVGMQGSSTNIGELWITYDITLLKPKLGSTVDVYDHWVLPVLSDNPIQPGGTSYFGSISTPPALTLDSDMGTTLSVVSPSVNGLNSINWPSGYTGNVAVIYIAGLATPSQASLATMYTVVGSPGVTPILAVGLTRPTNWYTNQINTLVYNATGGVTYLGFFSIVDGGSLTFFGGTTGPDPLTSGDLFIVALPSNFNTLGLPPVVTSILPALDLKTSPPESKSRPRGIIKRETRSSTPEDLELIPLPDIEDTRYTYRPSPKIIPVKSTSRT